MTKFLACLIALFLTTSVNARTISYDGGGVIEEYIDKYTAERDAGMTYVITGLCASACTMITGIIPKERVCVTEYATLAFHSASWKSDGTHSPSGTKKMWRHFSNDVKRYLKRHYGWNGATGAAHRTLINIPASKFYKVCNG